MKRNARRAVLFVCLAVAAGMVRAEPAAADNACVWVRVWVSGSAIPAGQCVPTPFSPTRCFWADHAVSGTGAGYTICETIV